MINLSIKRKLLIYNVLIQIFVIFLLSISIYKTLHISTLDKIQSSLKVIVLDIADDIMEHKGEIKQKVFDEEDEYKYKPLYVRLLDNKFQVINSTKFPKEIPSSFHEFQEDMIHFQEFENYIVAEIKLTKYDEKYVLQVATNYKVLNDTMQNLFYILIFIVPIILIFAIIGGYFLVYKSFSPIENMLINLKEINSTTLSKRLKTTNINDEINSLGEEINSLLERLEISFEKINQFSQDASHELKTPLTIIRGEIEIALRKDRSSEEYKETLKSCLDEVLNIQQTVDDLLFLAKNENSDLILSEMVYIDEITTEAVNELLPIAKQKDIKLEVKIENNSQTVAHSKLLKVAIKNIIKNAITFSHEKSNVFIKNYLENGKIVISIEDKGIGIPKNEQKKIFEKFYRTDKSRNKVSGGTGLGMAIVEKIVKIHNGKIELESSENIGTTVKIVLNKE